MMGTTGRGLRAAIVTGILGTSFLGLFGCGGGGRPAPAESPWEVMVITDTDTTVVPPGLTEADLSVPTTPQTPGEGGEWEVSVESPLDSLAQVREGTLPGVPPAEAPAAGAPTAAPTNPNPASSRREFTYGHRIQVMAASSLVQAESESTRADSLFAHPLYIEYEAPYFKVRLGDFLVRSRAERVLESDVRPLYPQAWVVDTMVRLTEH